MAPFRNPGAIARDGAHYAAEAVRLSRNQGSAGAADAVVNQNETAVTGAGGQASGPAAA